MGLLGGVPICGLRLRTGAAKRFKKADNAQAAIEGCLPGSQLCEWSPGPRGPGGESRLSLFTRLLTRALFTRWPATIRSPLDCLRFPKN